MMKNKTFLQKCKTGITLAVLAAVVAWVKPPATALAFNVTPIQMVEMYATSATPVYGARCVFTSSSISGTLYECARFWHHRQWILSG